MTNQATTSGSLVHEIGDHGRLQVRVADATVRMRGVDGATVRVVDPSGRDLHDSFDVSLGAGELSIRSRDQRFGLVFGFRRGATLEIDVPHEAAITVETASGDIAGNGLGGVQRYRTASGEVELHAVHGTFSIDTVSGDVRMRADDASELDTKTVSGEIDVTAPLLHAVGVTTTSGDARIDAPLEANGHYNIQSVSGDVVVRAHGGLRVEARTMTGSVRTTLAHQADESAGQRVLVVGGGGPTLSFRSLSGDLRVEAASSPGMGDAGAARTATALAAEDAPAPSGDTVGDGPDAAAASARLEILRALERGEIDVPTATARLAALEGGDR